jgi:hypothetical protein
LTGSSEFSENAADGHEPPRTAQSHQRRIEQEVGAEEIGLHDTSGIGASRALPESRRRRLTGVRHDDIELPPCLGCASYESATVHLVSHIARKMPRLPACVSDLANGLPQSALVTPAHQYARPPARELKRNRTPDTLSATGDDRNLSPEKGLGHAAASSTLTELSAPTIKGAVNVDTDRDEEERRARLRGRRMGLGVVLVVSLMFIAASSSQIVSAVFGLGTVPLAAGPSDSAERRCAEGISRLVRGLDPSGGGTPAATRTLEARWNAADPVEQQCQKATGGLDAWDALLRLRAAELQLSDPTPADLQPLRNEVTAHLPADLR